MPFLRNVVVGLLLALGAGPGPAADPPPKATPAEPVLTIGTPRFRHTSSLDYGAVAPDGRTLYTLTAGGDVVAWDLETGVARPLFKDTRLRNSLYLTPDGTQVVSISRDEVAVWDARTGAEVRRLPNSYSASAAVPAPDGKGIVVFREDRIEAWSDGRVRTVGKTAEFIRPAVSPDGRTIAAPAAGARPDAVVVYDAKTLAVRATLKTGEVAFAQAPSGLREVRIGFAPDGKSVALAEKDGLAVWDLAAAKVVKSLPARPGTAGEPGERITKLLYSADGKTICAGTAGGAVRRWDVAAGTELAPWPGHRSAVTVLLAAKAGARLVALFSDGVIRRWDTVTGKEIDLPDGYFGTLLSAAAPDGKSAVVLDAAGRLDVWDLAAGKRGRTLRPGDWGRIGLRPAFGFAGDGSRAYFADPVTGTVTVWSVADGKPVSAADTGTKGGKPGLWFCVPAPDGRSFAVNRGLNRLARIDAATGREQWVSDELFQKGTSHAPAFSPDGKELVLGVVDYRAPAGSRVDGRLELVRLDAATGKLLARADVETETGGSTAWFQRPEFSADGARLALPYGGFEVSVYDTKTWKLVRRHGVLAAAVALAPDGTWLATGESGELTGYDAATGKEWFVRPIADGWVSSLSILPGGRVLTSGPGGVARLWDVSAVTGKAGR
jgi:WD40 repeat protein